MTHKAFNAQHLYRNRPRADERSRRGNPTGQENCCRPQGNGWHHRAIDIHKLFKAQRANCKMTETDYAEKATQLLDILGDFEGLIAELADALRDRPAIAATNVSGTTGHRRVRIYRRMIGLEYAQGSPSGGPGLCYSSSQ